ncbi:valine--tRNA ligase, partial [candidate division KSB1 bacterium]
VREVFVRLYEEGLIYKDDYIINWCPRCHTALADIEVEHEEKDSFLYYIRYPFKDQDGYIVVATTRPETLLGDTAVAVNPEDKRYKDHLGKYVLLPVLKRPIPIIADSYVDMEFGTGALKITPAHDLNDFEIGNRHGLDRVKVIDENGRMNELAGPYNGMDRFECREKIVKDLDEEGLLEKIEPYKTAIGHCYRCKTVIEPLLSKQWFVKTPPLAKPAIEAVKSHKTRIFPSNWEAVYFEWMNNIRDWCISRQIWWGHRIPAWYCKNCGHINVARDEVRECKKCGSKELIQDEDVLDTWFSSALWPFSTLGWPDQTKELEVFYPTSLLVTGFDILFFWVARMMMMGIHFMNDVPFRHVYIHALVRDAEGKKMSKSRGNVIDPLEVMDKFGTDAFRFTLAALAAQGRDIKLSEEKIVGYRHFVNKLWNAARFVLMNIEEDIEIDLEAPFKKEGLGIEDKWIITRLSQVIKDVSDAIEGYRFNEAAGICYQFVWHEFCDWYVEMSKWYLYGDDLEKKKNTMITLVSVLSAILRILHPFMPFVTEEIWQKLPGKKKSIMVSKFPEPEDFFEDQEAVKEIKFVMDVITGIRNVRGELRIPPSKKVNVVIDAPERKAELINRYMHHVKSLAKVEDISIGYGIERPDSSATSVVEDVSIYVLLKGLLNIEEEKKRIIKEMKKLQKDIDMFK